MNTIWVLVQSATPAEKMWQYDATEISWNWNIWHSIVLSPCEISTLGLGKPIIDKDGIERFKQNWQICSMATSIVKIQIGRR